MLIHFNDIHQQSVRLDTILHVETDVSYSRDQTATEPPSKTYYQINLLVDIPAEFNFTGDKKREIRLWYDVNKEVMEADIKMLRMASSTVNFPTDEAS